MNFRAVLVAALVAVLVAAASGAYDLNVVGEGLDDEKQAMLKQVVAQQAEQHGQGLDVAQLEQRLREALAALQLEGDNEVDIESVSVHGAPSLPEAMDLTEEDRLLHDFLGFVPERSTDESPAATAQAGRTGEVLRKEEEEKLLKDFLGYVPGADGADAASPGADGERAASINEASPICPPPFNREDTYFAGEFRESQDYVYQCNPAKGGAYERYCNIPDWDEALLTEDERDMWKGAWLRVGPCRHDLASRPLCPPPFREDSTYFAGELREFQRNAYRCNPADDGAYEPYCNIKDWDDRVGQERSREMWDNAWLLEGPCQTRAGGEEEVAGREGSSATEAGRAGSGECAGPAQGGVDEGRDECAAALTEKQGEQDNAGVSRTAAEMDAAELEQLRNKLQLQPGDEIVGRRIETEIKELDTETIVRESSTPTMTMTTRTKMGQTMTVTETITVRERVRR